MNLKNKQGFALPLALGILFILTLLIHTFYQMISAERREEFRRYQKTQTDFSVLSGINYGLNQMNQTKKPWRTSGIQHASSDSTVVFFLNTVQEGSFSLLKISTPLRKDTLTFKTGFLLEKMPALTLTEKNTSVSLAGTALIHGDVAMHFPRVELSHHYKMPALSSAEFQGDTLGNSFPLWDSIGFYPEPSRNFFNQVVTGYEKSNCIFDGRDSLKGDYFCKSILMQGDSYCNECRLFADNVLIRGRSFLKNGFVTAIKIHVEEDAQISGHLFARDTLNIHLEKEQIGETIYALQGRKSGITEYTGRINVIRLKGKALILYLGDGWDASLSGVSVTLNEKVDLIGLVLVNGTLDLQGKVNGAVVASHLAFEESGTLWQGYLKNGRIISDPSVSFLVPDGFRAGGRASYEYR